MIKNGETYTSYKVGSRARVIDITDHTVTYEIIYHPTKQMIGYRAKMGKLEFASRTVKFNSDYKDHKRKLKI